MLTSRYLLAVSLLLIVNTFHAMKRGSSEISEPSSSSSITPSPIPLPASPSHIPSTVPLAVPPSPCPIETYFAPLDPLKEQLFATLDKATKQVLIAMYWITDHSLVSKLIELQRRGITIKIIVDESSPNRKEIMDRLLRNNIVPFIYPSALRQARMHDKFLVIDNAVVFTGSANFTKQAFSNAERSNAESVNIIQGADTARKYQETFNSIESKTFELYIDMIAKDHVTDWLKLLFPRLPLEYLWYVRLKQWGNFNSIEQDRLRKFFAAHSPKPRRPATEKQRNELRRYGYWPEEIDRMSSQKAYTIIGNHRQ